MHQSNAALHQKETAMSSMTFKTFLFNIEQMIAAKLPNYVYVERYLENTPDNSCAILPWFPLATFICLEAWNATDRKQYIEKILCKLHSYVKYDLSIASNISLKEMDMILEDIVDFNELENVAEFIYNLSEAQLNIIGY